MSQIQWFPGHMAKARREVTERLSLIDIVVELVDARIPESSRNPMIDEIVKDKRRLIVLNKADLADSQQTNVWLKTYQKMGLSAIAIDAQHQKGLKQLETRLKQMMASYFADRAAKGAKERPIRLMILGIPNVGKSTLINRFVGKNQAQTGNKPGVTKAQRWLKMGKQFELLDTPGILWPKFEDPQVGTKLALTGAIKDTLLHMDDLALALLDWMRQNYVEQLKKRYHIELDDNESTVDLLLRITKQMGLRDDYDEASQRIVQDFRKGRLGQITLDEVRNEETRNG